MKTLTSKHLHTFLNQKNIPFKALDFGVQIDRKFYDHNTFNYFECMFLDSTFLIDYKN